MISSTALSHQEACSFSGLGHAYQPDRWVFRNLACTIRRGECFALLGTNGCGKTTLLNALTGTLTASEGIISRNGRIAFVPQLFQVAFDYTVLDMVLMGRARQIGWLAVPDANDRAAALAALARFEMDSFAERPFSQLSGGQRQLVIFARAMLADADILILDEPTSALDFRNQNLILNWLNRLVHEQGLTVIFATHAPQHVLAIADRALLMFGATDSICGSADAVLSEANLLRLYGTPLKRVSFSFGGRQYETLTPVFEVDSRKPTGILPGVE